MNRRVVLLTSGKSKIAGVSWDKIGRVVTELAELYQTVKDSAIDLIVVDESGPVVTLAMGNRIRRFNGLVEIWLLTKPDRVGGEVELPLDGMFSANLGHAGIVEKVEHILAGKARLARYGIVGRSARMKALGEMIERIAPTDASVLVIGPSGSGKELVARALHDDSPRRAEPFVAFNCGALAEGVLESELFGHERGAFTGSVAKREGLFHKAGEGTIFLDEIGELKLDTQVKLLRVLEDGTYYPVGSSTRQKARARVVAATNRDLAEAIADKQFREDLYFRIGAVKVVVPPLMERKQDIQPLLQHFLTEKKRLEYTDSALDLLTRYDWPGNVRQLRNFASRISALNPDGLLEVEDVQEFLNEQHASATHLPVSTGRTVEQAGHELIYRAILSLGTEVKLLRDLIVANLPSEAVSGEIQRPLERSTSMENMERALIEQVLAETGGNRKETARRLGIGERTLYRKINKYDLH